MPLDFLDPIATYCDGGLSANIPYVPGHENLRVSVLAGPPEKNLIARGEGGLRLPGSVYMSGLKVDHVPNRDTDPNPNFSPNPNLHPYYDEK